MPALPVVGAVAAKKTPLPTLLGDFRVHHSGTFSKDKVAEVSGFPECSYIHITRVLGF